MEALALPPKGAAERASDDLDDELDAHRLFEAFAVVGVHRDAILEQVVAPTGRRRGGGGGGSGGGGTGALGAYAPGSEGCDVPLADRFFAARTLASYPRAAPGSRREASLATLPPFCFPDGVAFARLGARGGADARAPLRVPRFGTFVSTRDDFSRLYGYTLEFWDATADSLAELAGAGPLGAGGWSAPVVLCLLARAECARGAETVLRALHAAHVAAEAAPPPRPAPPLARSIAHVVRNAPRPVTGAPAVVLRAAGVGAWLGGGGGAGALPPLHYALRCLTHALDADGLLALFGALLLERRVALVAADGARLGASVLSACALLYPLVWQNVLVPLLPGSMLDAMHTPFPALLGLRLEQLLAQGRALPEGLVWVHLDRGRVDGAAASALPARERRWLRAELPRLLAAARAAADPASEAAVEADIQRTFCAALASLLRDADALLARGAGSTRVAPLAAPAPGAGEDDDGSDGSWRRSAHAEAALERALRRRPRAERGFVRELLRTQHARALLDALARARVERRLPAALLAYERVARSARAALFSPEPLPAGTWWFERVPAAPRGRAQPRAADDADAGEGEELVVAAEAPALEPAAPRADAPADAADARAARGTRFELDLASAPAAQLPLRVAAALATVACGADGAPDGPASPPPPSLLRAEVSRDLSELLLRAGSLRDELSIDAQRYAEDAAYRADVQRAQGRAGVAAAALTVGGAVAGALLCSVQ